MNKRIVIFGNGKLNTKFLHYLKTGDYIIGVDRAAYWLLVQGITPHVAIGDFDSVTKEELKLIKKSIKSIKSYPREKNWTDMELAVTHAISRKPNEVIIVGGTGTRFDHTLAAAHVLVKLLAAGIYHELVDPTNRIRLIGPGKTVIKKASYRYISILPYTKSISLSLTGFRYNVTRKTLKQGLSLGVSNELRGAQGTIHLFTGRAWVIESND